MQMPLDNDPHTWPFFHIFTFTVARQPLALVVSGTSFELGQIGRVLSATAVIPNLSTVVVTQCLAALIGFDIPFAAEAI